MPQLIKTKGWHINQNILTEWYNLYESKYSRHSKNLNILGLILSPGLRGCGEERLLQVQGQSRIHASLGYGVKILYKAI